MSKSDLDKAIERLEAQVAQKRQELGALEAVLALFNEEQAAARAERVVGRTMAKARP